jgi:hypothetical protein
MKKETITEKFEKFDSKNPHVYHELVKLAREMRSKRNDCVIGISLLYDVLRWNAMIKTDSDDEFKMGDNYKAFYARKIMNNESDLKGMFRTKPSVADDMMKDEEDKFIDNIFKL